MTFHQFLNIILFNKTKIIKITLISSLILFLILLFVYPRTYMSTVSILPPEKNNSFQGLGSLMGGGDFTSLRLQREQSTQILNSTLKYLKSRTASEFVIKKLNLIDYLDAEDLVEASEKLTKRLTLDLTKEGIVKVSVEVNTSLISTIFLEIRKHQEYWLPGFPIPLCEALDLINREKLSSKAKKCKEVY